MTKIISTLTQLKSFRKASVTRNKTINYVPTMGSFHKGHEELIKKAKRTSGICVVSIFVNPLQFSEKNDYLNYPKNLHDDLRVLKNLSVDYLIMISENEFLGSSFSSIINNQNPRNVLCENDRPGHFNGVATIIAKFLINLSPNFLYLGEKDFQQILIIEKLINDFNFDTRIIKFKTVREIDGLAFSSRNKLLQEKNRQIATFLFKSLESLKKQIIESNFDLKKIEELKKNIVKEGFEKVNYLDIRKEKDLSTIDQNPSKCRAFISANIDSIRLIDNLYLGKLFVSKKRIFVSD